MKETPHCNYLRLLVSAVCFISVGALAVIRLESVPPLWWDEGWNLSIARNWIEKGSYGREMMGDPAPPGLEASLTLIAPVVFAFRLFGVGIWQGRLVGLLFLIGAVSFLYCLALRIYSRSVANATLLTLFTMTMFAEWHPIIMGRQVLGEMPMLFFILGGYVCFYLTLSRSLWFMPLTVFLWATGVVIKGQVPPFFIASLALPLLMTFRTRQWKPASLVIGGLVSCLVTVEVFLWFKWMFIERDAGRSPLPQIYDVIAFVPILEIRWRALQASLFLLPTILGILYEARKSCRLSHWSREKSNVDIVRIAILAFTGSWLAWYIFASNPSYRYAFPPVFVGSIFVAKLIRDLMDREAQVFSWTKTGTSNETEYARVRMSPERLLALMLIVVWSFATLKMLYQVYIVEGNQSAKHAAQFLNTQTPPDALIETYDSELHFLLNRRYHFPPDYVHLDLIRRTYPGNQTKVRIDYDPLAADPDYLVVGGFMSDLGLYDPVLRSGAFQLIRSFNKYNVYKRVR